jgi:hypothetical protein
LIVAKDNADADEKWITEAYNDAVAKATDDERTRAYRHLEKWLKSRREAPDRYTRSFLGPSEETSNFICRNRAPKLGHSKALPEGQFFPS